MRKEKQKPIKMKKLSPLKFIQILAVIMLLLIAVEYLLDAKMKTPLTVLRVITAIGIIVFAMFNGKAIEQEKIEREKAKAN